MKLEDKHYTLAHWREAVQQGDTTVGYRQWVRHMKRRIQAYNTWYEAKQLNKLTDRV